MGRDEYETTEGITGAINEIFAKILLLKNQ